MLEGFVPVAAASELPPGAMKRVVVGGERTLVVNVGGDFYALRDVCGHAGAPLSTTPASTSAPASSSAGPSPGTWPRIRCEWKGTPST